MRLFYFQTCPAGHTLEVDDSNCLLCEQDREYAQSLAIDREIRRREEAEERRATEAAEAVEQVSNYMRVSKKNHSHNFIPTFHF